MKGREGGSPLVIGFILKKPVTSVAVVDWRQKPETQSGSPMFVAGT